MEAAHAAPNHKAAVRQFRVLFTHLLCGDEVHFGVIIRKVVRHVFDFRLDCSAVRIFRGNDKDLSLMHLPRGELRLLALTDTRHGALHGNRVLSRIQHARNAAHRIGVALAHALAPEGIVLALRQNRGCQHTV